MAKGKDPGRKWTGKVKIGAGPVPIQKWRAPVKKGDVLDANGFKGGDALRPEHRGSR